MEIQDVTFRSKQAFITGLSKTSEERALLLRSIADEIEALGDELLQTASAESNLPIVRFQGERARTCGQLRMFAKLIENNTWEGIIKEHAIPDRSPIPKPDIRMAKYPIGPIVVFGASNFPLAYSTAGGDTASALAAGCSVIYKSHPAHINTCKMVNHAIANALEKNNYPQDLFIRIEANNDEVKNLIENEVVQGVGFTGSLQGGMAIHKYAQNRIQPIPVFAEMGSTNPVIFLENALKNRNEYWADQYFASITAGVGQFCTNPGLLFGVKSESLNIFIEKISQKFEQAKDYQMLNESICKNYYTKRNELFQTKGVTTLAIGNLTQENSGIATLAKISGSDFLKQKQAHQEVFGPFSLIVECDDVEELFVILNQIEGQLTATIIGEKEDENLAKKLIPILSLKAGRLVFNSVPTGVEVCDAMVHGGPYPATTDARFSSVGSSAILRWVRPIAFQNFPQELLPDRLRD